MTKKIVEPKPIFTTRFVKSEDLNHHGTLFAGRTAEWVVEAGFIAAASLINPKCIACLKIHGMHFSKPVRPGEILKFTSKIVYTGKTSLTAFISVTKGENDEEMVSSYITFINVDENTKSATHNIESSPITEEDIALYEIAKNLKNIK